MKKTLLTLIILATVLTGFAQVAINSDGSSPNSNAMLDVKSSDKGFLIPRMTTSQRTTFGALLGAADAGMMVYDTDLKVLFVFDGSIWVSSTSYWIRNNDYVFNTTDSVGIGTATPGAELDVQGHIWQTGTGGSVFLGKSAGAHDDYSYNFNVFVGDSAGNLNTTGSRNVAMGYQALLKNKSGDGNIAIGNRALYRSTKNTNLIAIGDSALFSADSNYIIGYEDDVAFANNFIAIGNNALKNQSAGKSNTVIGHSAVENGGIFESIIIGDSALTSGHADSSVVIGNKALFNNIHQEGVWPHASVIIGDRAMYNFGNWASGGTYGDFFQNTVIGARAFYHLLDGEHNVAVGRSVGNGLTGAQNNVAIGDFAMLYLGSSSVTPEYNVSVGHYSGKLSTDSKFNTSIGYGAGALVKYYNVAVGYGALGGGQTDVENNVAIGADALYSSETNNNIGIGHQALQNNVNGSQNLALGYRAGANSSGSNNIFIGLQAGLDETGNNMLLIGNNSPIIKGDLSTGDLIFSGQIKIGGGNPGAGKVLTSDASGLATWEIPDPPGAYEINDLTDAIYDGSSLYVGYGAGTHDDGNNDNTAVGKNALWTNISGIQNVVIGENAGYQSTGNGNIFIGYNAGSQETGNNKLYIANSNTSSPLIGGDFSTSQVDINGTLKITGGSPASGRVLTSDADGLASWQDAVGAIDDLSDGKTTTGSCVFLGSNAGASITTGTGNTGLGLNALNAVADGSQNTALGYQALKSNVSGNGNTATGFNAISTNTSGSSNTAIGYYAGFNNSTGSGNVFLGYQAGYNETGSNKLYIANSNTATPLIGGDFSAGQVDINGVLKITGGNPGNGKILTSDANGLASWGTAPVSADGSIDTHSDVDVSTNAPTNGQVLGWNGNNWVPADDNLGAQNIDDLSDAISDGTYTLFLGTGAGASNTASAFYNTAVGLNALNANTAGSFNTALGYESMKNTTGGSNTAVGYSTLNANTTGYSNFAGGTSALAANVVGYNNTATGSAAMASNTSGNNNAGYGYQALNANNDGFSNTAVGSGSLKRNTSADNNVAVGFEALNLVTTNGNNTAIGTNAGHDATGTGNVFIGYQAGFSESGDNKLYIANSTTSTPLIGGDFSTSQVDINGTIKITGGSPGTGKVLTSDADGLASWQTPATPTVAINDLTDAVYDGSSLFMGNGAGSSDGGSNNNTGVGRNALNANVTGDYNSAFGLNSLLNNTAGSFNDAFGNAALKLNTTGSNNAAFGYTALSFLTSGNGNAAFGWAALNQLSSGDENIAIGYGAGLLFSGGAYTTGTHSIFIGPMTMSLNDGDTNQIVIGRYAVGLGSNTVVIGNDDIDTTALYGKVGIGTTTPQSKLQVNGGVQVANDTDDASADKVGTLRYRADSNNSYVEMCVQTGATTYAWVVIHQETW